MIVGNVVLYGAIKGDAFFRGMAGERFAVRRRVELDRHGAARAAVVGKGEHLAPLQRAVDEQVGGHPVVHHQTVRADTAVDDLERRCGEFFERGRRCRRIEPGGAHLDRIEPQHRGRHPERHCLQLSADRVRRPHHRKQTVARHLTARALVGPHHPSGVEQALHGLRSGDDKVGPLVSRCLRQGGQ
ncbi:MAG: hypothetical protein WCP59_14560 [Actinomycetota bacterium]